MAIETILVNTSDTALYTSISDSAITMMSLCNYGAAQISATMHIVKSGDTPGVHNLLIKDIIIPAIDNGAGINKILLYKPVFLILKPRPYFKV